jgi:thiol-disulfide isomerase/thioredoxin
MKIKLIVIIGLVITTFAACSNTANETPSSKVENAYSVSSNRAVATTLPSFKVIAIDGSIINLADLKGRKVFVNLWASWCPPCRAEIPSIEKLKTKVDPQKVVFVMLSLDENFELAKNFAKKNKMQLPVYYPAETLPAMFNTNGIPATFIFNEKGELIKANNGMDDYNTDEYVQLLKG